MFAFVGLYFHFLIMLDISRVFVQLANDYWQFRCSVEATEQN